MARSGSRLKTVFCCALVLVVWNCFSGLQAFAQTKSNPAAPVIGKYVGAGSCSAKACHGGIEDSGADRAMQTEYGTWIIRDAHAKAYKSLLDNQVSLRMAKILKLENPPAKDKRCIVCHALSPEPGKMERVIDFKSEGVGCESCHGPASGWLESHIRKNEPTAKSVSCGMYDIRNVEFRTKRCLECHLGTDQKEVDHSMIAAGHPDLIFQLELYSAKQPPHWRLPDDPHNKAVPKDASYGVRLWAVGQAVQLREALDRLERRAQADKWPEFSEYNCFSCHHSLSKPETSWRQERDCDLVVWIKDPKGSKDPDCSFIKPSGGWPQLSRYDNKIGEGKNAGLPQWNSAHYSVFLLLAEEINPAITSQLKVDLGDVYQITSTFKSSNDITSNIKRAADSARKKADALVKAITSANFDSPQVANLLEKISASGDLISFEDTRSAEQAWMALDSLLRCYERQSAMKTVSQNGKTPGLSDLHHALDEIYHEFDNPSGFSGPKFASGMRKFNEVLHSSGVFVARASR